MLFDKLTPKEKRNITDYIEYAVNYDSVCDLKYFLRFWNEKKSNLYKMLRDQFIYSKEVEFNISLEELSNTIEEKLDTHDFIEALKTAYYDDRTISRDFVKIISPMVLAENRIKEKVSLTFYKKTNTILTFNAGTKTIKALRKVAKELNIEKLFEDFRLEHSLLLNQKKLKGDLCLSIHPLDFFTMSDNNYGWSTCLSWLTNDGLYRRGAIEMLNSANVLVAYLKGREDTELGGIEWNNKKWRQLFIVHPKIICGIKSYPYKNDYLTQKCLDIIAELLRNTFGYKYEKKSSKIGGHLKPFYTDNFGELFKIELEASTMYNDLKYNIYLCRIKKDYDSSEEGDIDFNFSGEEVCVKCGQIEKRYEFNSSLICDNCDGGAEKCSICGDYIDPDDLYYDYGYNYMHDEYCICKHCFESHCQYSLNDEEYHLLDNLYRITIHFDDYSQEFYITDLNDKNFLDKYFLINEFKKDSAGHHVYHFECKPEFLKKFRFHLI